MILNSAFIWITLSVIIQCCIAGQDYYKILGVNRNADANQLKRAFKKLSIKYHPDKNQGNEEAQKKFAEIVNAYEVLKDPEQKRLYDKYGEDGIKDGKYKQQEQWQNGGNWNDMFGRHFRHEQQHDTNFFSQSDVFQFNMNGLSKFYRRHEVWVMFFYDSNSRESLNYKDMVRDLASKFYGIFLVAGLDCANEQELCEEFEQYEKPAIQIFRSNINSQPIKYKGELNVNKISNAAIKEMESFVWSLYSEERLQEFISTRHPNRRIILFTDKKYSSPMLMALSKDFKDKFLFGEVRKSNEVLVNKFGIQKFPTLMVLTEPSNFAGEIYEGDMKKEQIMKFVRTKAIFEGGQNVEKLAEKKVLEFDQKASKKHENCGPNDQGFCLLILYSNQQQRDQVIEVMEKLAPHFGSDPIKLFHAYEQTVQISNILNDNHVPEVFPASFIIKGKKQRYSVFEGEFNFESLKLYVEDISAGGGRFYKMHDPLHFNVFQKSDEL